MGAEAPTPRGGIGRNRGAASERRCGDKRTARGRSEDRALAWKKATQRPRSSRPGRWDADQEDDLEFPRRTTPSVQVEARRMATSTSHVEARRRTIRVE
jgi:hypothetical protein